MRFGYIQIASPWIENNGDLTLGDRVGIVAGWDKIEKNIGLLILFSFICYE